MQFHWERILAMSCSWTIYRCYMLFCVFCGWIQISHRMSWSTRSKMNSGVCISDSNFALLLWMDKKDITSGIPWFTLKQIVLFKCEWFDPTMDVGVKRTVNTNWLILTIVIDIKIINILFLQCKQHKYFMYLILARKRTMMIG